MASWLATWHMAPAVAVAVAAVCKESSFVGLSCRKAARKCTSLAVADVILQLPLDDDDVGGLGWRRRAVPCRSRVLSTEPLPYTHTVKNVRTSADILWRVFTYFNGTGFVYVCIRY